MSTESPVLIAALLGLILAWVARFPVDWLVRRVKGGIPVPAPSDSDSIKEKWKLLTVDPDTDRSGALLGDFERVLFYLAFWLSAHELIAGWFALKVAAKWEAWGTTGRLPESLDDGIDKLSYLISRRRWASQRLMSFLVGTLANVIAALASFIVTDRVLKPLFQQCLS